MASAMMSVCQGAESLRPLLDDATEYVPKSSWHSTPLALKATAGLRLLSEETAQQLLSEVGIVCLLFTIYFGMCGQ